MKLIITTISTVLQAELLGTVLNSLIDVTSETLIYMGDTRICKTSPIISNSKT